MWVGAVNPVNEDVTGVGFTPPRPKVVVIEVFAEVVAKVLPKFKTGAVVAAVAPKLIVGANDTVGAAGAVVAGTETAGCPKPILVDAGTDVVGKKLNPVVGVIVGRGAALVATVGNDKDGAVAAGAIKFKVVVGVEIVGKLVLSAGFVAANVGVPKLNPKLGAVEAGAPKVCVICGVADVGVGNVKPI